MVSFTATAIVFTDSWIHGSTCQSPVAIKCYFSMCTVLNEAFILINAVLNKHKYQDTPICKARSYHLSNVYIYAIKCQSYLKCIHLWLSVVLHEFHICMQAHFPSVKSSTIWIHLYANENQDSVISLSATYLNCFVSCTR